MDAGAVFVAEVSLMGVGSRPPVELKNSKLGHVFSCNEIAQKRKMQGATVFQEWHY